MLRRLGYVAIALSINAATNRTCRLRNATPERLRELIRSNLEGLRAVLDFNVAHGIRLYRISSQIIPFGSHPVNTLPWWEEFGVELREIGSFIRLNDMRVSMHPGQFTVLNSTNPETVAASIQELTWHTQFLDALQVDATHKIVLHGGGGKAAKPEAMQRFVDIADGLHDAIRRRLVLENDDRIYTANEILDISHCMGVPVVFDWLHHNANHEEMIDTEQVVAACYRTWTALDGVPKVHVSSQQVGGRPGAHADWVDPSDMEAILAFSPDVGIDCMLEAKQKDRALLRLRELLRDRGIVEQTF